MFRYAIIGFGGLGKKHLINLKQLERTRGDISLAAICGTNEAEAKKNVSINIGNVDVSQIDFSSCNFYQDYKEMFDNEKLDFVLSVLPTYLHEEVALYTLSKGVHIFSEKPMALSLEGCKKMINASVQNNKVLMIGHCLRFYEPFIKIREYINEKRFGNVREAWFERYSQTPLWSWNNWILDPEKSGGCVLDVHVHDVDLINWLFKSPKSLRSHVKSIKLPMESIFTCYDYDSFKVYSRADWSLPQTYPFTSRCRVDFDEATVVVENNKLSVYKDVECISCEYDLERAYYDEINAFLDMIIDNKPTEITSAESIMDSCKIAFLEIESGKTNKKIFL